MEKTKEKVKTEKKETKVNEEITSLQEKLKLTEDKLLRMQAEYVNYRNRQAKTLEEMLKYEGEDLIKEILPVVDNFERAIKLDDNDLTDELSKFLSGFKMIYGNLITTLNSHEIKEIEVLGKEFNPVFAEAVITEEDESKPAGVVLEVLAKGYTYKDRVIRPAMVKVNK